MIYSTTKGYYYPYNLTTTSTTTDCSGYVYIKPSIIDSWKALTEALDKRKEITEEEIVDLVKDD